MDTKGLCELIETRRRKLNFVLFFFWFSLSIIGCDRPKAVEEEVSVIPEEKIKKVELDAKPIELPKTAPQVIIDKSSRVTILGYHQITDRGNPSEMRIPVSKFRSQMQALKDAGVSVISLDDYLMWKKNKRPIPETCVILTIDDGYDDLYDYALPILKEFNYPFTFYLYTNFLGGSGRTLNDKEVKELLSSGGELGSHSVSHDFLIRAKRKFGDNKKYEEWLLKEIKGSKDSLEKKFGVKIKSFAYPYGEYSDFLANKIKEAGYSSAVTVNGSKANYGSLSYELPRYIIHGNNDINWKAGTSFGGNVGLVNQLNTNKTSVDGGTPKIKTWPVSGGEIVNRLPEIRVDLSDYKSIDPEKIKMQVTGFGVVPFEFNSSGAILKWKIPRKLRVKSTTVILSFEDPLDGSNKSFSWGFNVNLKEYYLPEYEENLKKEKEAIDEIFSD